MIAATDTKILNFKMGLYFYRGGVVRHRERHLALNPSFDFVLITSKWDVFCDSPVIDIQLSSWHGRGRHAGRAPCQTVFDYCTICWLLAAPPPRGKTSGGRRGLGSGRGGLQIDGHSAVISDLSGVTLGHPPSPPPRHPANLVCGTAGRGRCGRRQAVGGACD